MLYESRHKGNLPVQDPRTEGDEGSPQWHQVECRNQDPPAATFEGRDSQHGKDEDLGQHWWNLMSTT